MSPASHCFRKVHHTHSVPPHSQDLLSALCPRCPTVSLVSHVQSLPPCPQGPHFPRVSPCTQSPPHIPCPQSPCSPSPWDVLPPLHSCSGSPQWCSWHWEQTRPPKPGRHWHCPVTCSDSAMLTVQLTGPQEGSGAVPGCQGTHCVTGRVQGMCGVAATGLTAPCPTQAPEVGCAAITALAHDVGAAGTGSCATVTIAGAIGAVGGQCTPWVTATACRRVGGHVGSAHTRWPGSVVLDPAPQICLTPVPPSLPSLKPLHSPNTPDLNTPTTPYPCHLPRHSPMPLLTPPNLSWP